MHNQSHRIKLNTKSKLGVIVLSIVLLTGISLVPTLQIGVQGRGQPHRLTTPGASPGPATSPPPPTPGTSAAPSTTPAPPTPGTSPPLSSATIRPPSGFGVVGEAANQGATVVIPQSSVMTMLDNLQTAMNAVTDDEDAMMALESVVQELKSAATAAGMSVENTTDGGDIR
jgi:hypothetical protein